MVSWSEQQSEFANALEQAREAVPSFILNPAGWGKPTRGQQTQRFNVYRNNVFASLIDVISGKFPVVKALVGDEFFHGMAHVYCHHHLPSNPVIIDYGASFADFIASFEPARSLAYLSDVARLEWAWQWAYHGNNEATIAISELQSSSVEGLSNIGFKFHPTVMLIKSDWPIFSIWLAHQTVSGDAHQAEALSGLPIEGNPEHVLIVRPALDVLVRKISPASFKFIEDLKAGMPLGEAASRAGEVFDDFDLSNQIAGLFTARLISGLSTEQDEICEPID